MHTLKPIWYSMNTYLICDSPLLEIDAAAPLPKSRRIHRRVNRSYIWSGFRAGCKAIRYSVKIALDFWGIGSGILCVCMHLIRYRVNIALDFWGIGSGVLRVGEHLIGSINLFSST